MNKTTPALTDQRVKNWKHLLTSDAPFQVESIKIVESNIFAPQTITFPRVLALIGLHGSGKTLLLRLLEAAFGYTNRRGDAPPFFRDSDFRPGLDMPTSIEGIIEVTLRTPNGVISRVVDLGKPPGKRAEIWQRDLGDSYSVWYLGPLQAFSDMGYLFQNYDVTYRDMQYVEKSLVRNLTADELHFMRNILGRRYESLSLETIAIDDYPVPYFSGIYQSRHIDSSSMSSGELWVHYVNWWFEDTADGNLMIIDEPEAFLAARGRRPFIDCIASQALKRRLQLFVGTHSPEVLARFPLDNIRMCLADSSGIKVRPPTSFVQIQDIIGMTVPVRGLILVEDTLAKQLLGEIFAQYDIALTRETEIIPVGGASEVIDGIRILRQMNRLGVVGILDGNERDKAPSKRQAKVDAIGESILFLPGDKAPEEELLSGARREAAWIAKIMGRTVNDIDVAINSCQSLDHQYQLNYLASQFGRAESAVIFMLTQAWLRGISVRRQAEKLVRDVRGSVPTESP